MARKVLQVFALLLTVALSEVQGGGGIVRSFTDLGGKPYNVSYNSRSMLVGGKPVLLLSGSVHYVRSTPLMWLSIFAKMKASGLNCVESYVFWNYHVTSLEAHTNGTADYSGRGNVTLFLQLAAEYDLFVIWRIGPYICAEWPGGGMPSWLGQIKGMHARSATQPYQDVCYDWMHAHIELVRPFFAQNGGPIIMTQMENELSGPSNTAYVEWLGTLATELKTGLPWIMCHGAHANNTLETCNGCDCTGFVDGLIQQGKPAMWTEDEQWFDRFEQGLSVRTTGDLGRGTAAFIAAGGSMHNYYMFHGGTMWGNWSTTVRRTRLTPSYATTANLQSDSIIYDPKYSVISQLHHVLANYSATILNTPVPISGIDTTGSHTWQVTLNGTSDDPAITFLFNDKTNATSVSFNGTAFEMAARSSRILDNNNKCLWYSEPDTPDSVGQPYLATSTSPLTWTSWEDKGSGGTWYRTSFERPIMPTGAQLSINMTGFGQGNLFLNGVHVVYYNLAYGECFRAPGGVNAHGKCDGYIEARCDKPTQDCYHVPPEWIADDNDMLVFSQAKMPLNVTSVDPRLASVVYRVDPPSHSMWR